MNISHISSSSFGMLISERSQTFGSKAYRYGFNGQERDDEVKGQGYSLDFGARVYDSRIGRWMSIDPRFDNPKNISISTYSYANNGPILYIDKNGEIFTLPAALVAGVVGFVADVTTQVAVNMVSGQSFKESLKSVDWADAAITGGEAALATATAGASLIATRTTAAVLRSSVDISVNEQNWIGGPEGHRKKLADVGVDLLVEGVAAYAGNWVDGKVDDIFKKIPNSSFMRPAVRNISRKAVKKGYGIISNSIFNWMKPGSDEDDTEYSEDIILNPITIKVRKIPIEPINISPDVENPVIIDYRLVADDDEIDRAAKEVVKQIEEKTNVKKSD